jgi:predicted metalloprotease
MRRKLWQSRALGVLVATALVLTGCTVTMSGHNQLAPQAPNANLPVVGDSHDSFDQTVKNALSDVMAFWRVQYPSISGGKPLPELKGKLYSVDGVHPSDVVKTNGCLRKAGTDVIVDNAFYCEIDDSIAWDRNSQHLVPVLGAKYGPLLVAMVFAHEFGHALQERLGLFNQQVPTIVHETQADCAAGAFAAAVVRNEAPHFHVTPADLDRALVGYLNVRDDTPASEKEISHGDGFDRIGAVAAGFQQGPTECYKADWADREFTERPYAPGEEQQATSPGGNEPFELVIDASPPTQNGGGGGGLQPDLNKFWKRAADSVHKPWKDVKIAEAAHPKCGDTSSKFGYCPNDNTVYFDRSYAEQAYNSLSVLNIDPLLGNVSIVENQPADFALGTLFVFGWGLAVRHQLFGRSLDDGAALLAASCYAGAYAKNTNVPPNTQGHEFFLSPPDMDEATSAVLSLVGSDQAYGSRGTTGFSRVQAFIKGYQGSLGVC